MVITTKAFSFILLVALFSMNCMGYVARDSDDERQYDAREILDILLSKRITLSNNKCIRCATTCIVAFSELGQTGTVVDALDLISRNAKDKAAFCRLYERAYPPHLNGKLDYDAYKQIIKEAEARKNMNVLDKAKCVVGGLKADVINGCLAIAEKLAG